MVHQRLFPSECEQGAFRDSLYYRQPASSLCQRNSNYHTATGQENSIPAAAPYGSVTQNSQHGWQRESTYGRGQEYAMASSSWPKQHSQVGRSRFANQQPPAASTLTMQTPVPGSAVGTAKEPNRDMVSFLRALCLPRCR